MSFAVLSNMELALILLCDEMNWSQAVHDAVKKRQETAELGYKMVELRNFVFIADFAPGSKAYTNTTAFVDRFELTELMYLLLFDLGDIRRPTDDEKTRLKNEYDDSDYQLSPEAKAFRILKVFVFCDFSKTSVLDMGKLVHLLYGGAYFVFYKQYYQHFLKECGRKEAPGLSADTFWLYERLMWEQAAAQSKAAAQAAAHSARSRAKN
jgi:hypothetical protein